MRYLNYIDLGYQTLVLLGVTLIGIGLAISSGLGGLAITAFYGGALLGPWQVISSLITTIGGAPFRKQRIIHLTGSVIVIVVLSALASQGSQYQDTMIATLTKFLLFVLPAMLAVYYYVITYKTFKTRRAQVA